MNVSIPPALPHPDEEDPAEGNKDHQTNNLEDQTGLHDSQPDIAHGFVVRHAHYRAAGGLQDEGDEVAGDEEDGVGSRPEVGEALAEDDDYPGETEVDACCYEDGGYGCADEVPVTDEVRKGGD